MIISVMVCPKCGFGVFSRARHDARMCPCGAIFVDGGFDYRRVGMPADSKPLTVDIEVTQTKKELYNDWNNGTDKYGLLSEKELQKCEVGNVAQNI